jgi:hypothetical protein
MYRARDLHRFFKESVLLEMLFNTLVWSVIFDVIVFSLCGITQMMTISVVVTCSVFTFLYYVRTRWQKCCFFGSTCFHFLLQHNGMCLIRIVKFFVITVCFILFYDLNFLWLASLLGPWPSQALLVITFSYIAVGRTSLDEWSARRRDLYLTNKQHSQETDIHDPWHYTCSNPVSFSSPKTSFSS